MKLTKCDEMIWGKRDATSIPCTSGPSNPTSLAAAESVCKGFESQLTLEYWRTSSSVYTLAFLKTSPGLSTLGVPEVKHLRLREWTLWQCKFLTSILARVQINKTRPWCGPSLTVNQVKCNLIIPQLVDVVSWGNWWHGLKSNSRWAFEQLGRQYAYYLIRST